MKGLVLVLSAVLVIFAPSYGFCAQAGDDVVEVDSILHARTPGELYQNVLFEFADHFDPFTTQEGRSLLGIKILNLDGETVTNGVLPATGDVEVESAAGIHRGGYTVTVTMISTDVVVVILESSLSWAGFGAGVGPGF